MISKLLKMLSILFLILIFQGIIVHAEVIVKVCSYEQFENGECYPSEENESDDLMGIFISLAIVFLILSCVFGALNIFDKFKKTHYKNISKSSNKRKIFY